MKPPRATAPLFFLFIAVCSIAAGSGCASGGPPAEFEGAQRLAHQQNKELFVYYESWLSTDCGRMQQEIESPAVRHQLNGRVVCVLDESYEPNQRFVEQYGVDRYPAVILIHRDGTYHRRVGHLDAEQLVQFLENAQPPGNTPMINPQLPRRVEYEWQADYEIAFETARRQGRPVFIFYKSVISADCNEMLFNVLSRSDVAVQFHDSVNCLLDWGYPPNRKLLAGYGVTDVPAVVFIRPDGTRATHQGLMTPAQLISFVRRAKTEPGIPAGGGSVESTP